jgi:hypothetical protein
MSPSQDGPFFHVVSGHYTLTRQYGVQQYSFGDSLLLDLLLVSPLWVFVYD